MSDNASALLLPVASASIQDSDGPIKMEKDEGRLTTFGIDRNFANVLTMSFSYLLVFSAFQTTQMLAASLLGDLGNYSVAIIYMVFTAGGFFGPAIVGILGPRKGMFLGSLTYVLFVGSLIYMIVPVILACSAIIGFGASVMWNSQGMMMTACTNQSNKSKYNSMFWGIFNLSLLPGNIAGHFILMHSSSSSSGDNNPFKPLVKGWSHQNSPLFMVLTIIGGIGSALFLMLRKADPKNGTPPSVDNRTVGQQIMGTFMATFMPRLVCLIPLFAFTGVGMTMWASWFTRQIYKTEIGLVMCAMGAGEFIGGFTIGRFIEAYGRWPALAFGTSCLLGACYLTISGYDDMSDYCGDLHPLNITDGSAKPCSEYNNYARFFVAALLFGFMDCTFQTVTAAICASAFEATGNTADAWGLFRTFQSLGSAICFFLSPKLVAKGETYSTKSQFMVEVAITVSVCFLSLFGLWLFSKYPSGTTMEQTKKDNDDDEIKYSAAVASGGIVMTSAIGDGCGKGASTYEMATKAFEGVQKVLENSASSCKQAMKVQIATTADADMKVVLERYQDFFVCKGVPAPALSTCVVADLQNNNTVQVEVTAGV